MNRIEAHSLICSAQSGDTDARNTLIEYYCNTLVPALAASWGRLTYDDAVSIGNLATVESVDAALLTYDSSQPSGIAAYVRRAIVRALSQADYQALAIHGPTKPNERDDIPKARLSLSAIVETADYASNPETAAIRAETRDQLTHAFDSMLSPWASRIMTCLYFEDMDANTTAQRVGSTPAHVDYIRSVSLKVLRSNPALYALLTPTN